MKSTSTHITASRTSLYGFIGRFPRQTIKFSPEKTLKVKVLNNNILQCKLINVQMVKLMYGY